VHPTLIGGPRRFRESGPSPRERERRHKREFAAAEAMILAIVGADHRLSYAGADPAAQSLAAEFGFAPHDLNVVRLSVLTRPILAIIAPPRLWYSAEKKVSLLALKRELRSRGRVVVVVSGRLLRRQPLLDNAELIAKAPSIAMTASDRMKIEMHLMTEGISTLEDCARIVEQHPDPFGVVLSLVRSHRLHIDLRAPLSPHTTVWAPSARRN
jgi:hypothetical protein